MKTYQFIKHLYGLESLLNWAINVVLADGWNVEYPWKSTKAAIGSSSTELIIKKLIISRKKYIKKKTRSRIFIFCGWRLLSNNFAERLP